ncbi:MAG: hypothetical protein PHF67_04145 [Candidatus Nanoarchaeia archaeon]|nr:hypothetical protein [Candidatus Nanoarchaeia archaeon]
MNERRAIIDFGIFERSIGLCQAKSVYEGVARRIYDRIEEDPVHPGNEDAVRTRIWALDLVKVLELTAEKTPADITLVDHSIRSPRDYDPAIRALYKLHIHPEFQDKVNPKLDAKYLARSLPA